MIRGNDAEIRTYIDACDLLVRAVHHENNCEILKRHLPYLGMPIDGSGTISLNFKDLLQNLRV